MINDSMLKEINREGRESGFPYSLVYVETNELFQFDNLKSLYHHATSTIREYVKNGYVAIIESCSARHAIHDKESYYKAITDGWLFQLEDEENKIITIEYYRRA